MSWRGVTIRGFLFALIGAAATVLVAWAIATHQRSHHPHQSPIPGMVHSSISRFYPGDRPWPLHAHRQLKLPAVNPSEVHAWRGVGISVTLFATNLQELSASGLEFLELRDTGWPSPAMSEVRLVRRVGGPTDAIVIPRRSHPDSAFLLLPSISSGPASSWTRGSGAGRRLLFGESRASCGGGRGGGVRGVCGAGTS